MSENTNNSRGAKKRATANNVDMIVTQLSSSLAERVVYPKNLRFNNTQLVDFDRSGKYVEEIERMMLGPLHSSLIRAKINMTFGRQILYNINNEKVVKLIKNKTNRHNLDYHIKNATKDLFTWGGYYLLFRFNSFNEIAEIEHVDFKNVRAEINEFGKINRFAYSHKFNKKIYGGLMSGFNDEDVVYYERFDAKLAEKKSASGIKEQLYYFYDNQDGGIYPVADYYALKNYIYLDFIFSDFHLNNTLNNFVPGMIVKYPSQPSQKMRDSITQNMLNNFSNAAGGAGKMWMLFNETAVDGSEQEVKIEAFETTGNADIYRYLQEVVIKMITTHHQYPSTLLGLSSDSLSISGKSEEIANYYELLAANITDIKQGQLLESLDTVASFNKIEDAGFSFKTPIPLKFRLSNELINAVNAKILTLEEARKIVGLDYIQMEVGDVETEGDVNDGV